MSISRRRPIGVVSLVAILVLVASACSRDGRKMSEPNSDQFQSIAIATTIAATIAPAPETAPNSNFALAGQWTDGGAISPKYTCAGDSISPPLQFSGVPAGTVTLGLVLTDQDANGIVHWAVANIPAVSTNIAEGVLPNGAIQATTAQGSIGYWAPCPPSGQTHRYLMTAYAIAQQLEFADGVDAATLQAAFQAGALTVAETGFIVQTP